MRIPEWQDAVVVSGRTARRLLEAPAGELEVSLDLGRSRDSVTVEERRIALPDGQRVDEEELADSFSDPEDCVELRDGEPRKVYFYDSTLRCYYKLFQPFEDRPPTIVINGATMHPVRGAGPWEGTEEMVRAVPSRGGECLDTCCGLGYSAQMLADTQFTTVTTCEVDRNVLTVASLNPWSQGLFSAPNIRIHYADMRDFLAECRDGRFSCVFHDPPTIYQAGELYSEELYKELRRVLGRGGVLYHYVGAPGGRWGRDYAHGVIQRLQSAGFARAKRVTGGVLAVRRDR